MRRTLGFALFLFAVGCLVGHVCGCHPAVVESVENAAAVAQYKLLLVDCREKGKATKLACVADGGTQDHCIAEGLAVRDTCADATDAMLCRESALRCTDGGA